MTKTTNVMAIAPTPAASTRTTSQGTQQPRYKTTQRTSKRNFGSTLDQVHAKLDELKQSVQDLQDANKKIAQVDDDAQSIDVKELPAQGTSDTPQEDGKAISNAQCVMRNGMQNDSETVANEDIQPADIFFDKDKSVVLPDMAYLFVANSETLLETKPVAETPQSDSVPSLMSVMPQTNQSNSQTMLNMLGGRSWRLIETPQSVDVQLSIQPQALETAQPADVKPSIQPQALETAQPVDLQPSIQPQVVETVQPADVKPSIQPQVIETPQPLDVQPTVQLQATETAQPADVQQSVRPQVLETAQPIDVKPSIQPQAVETPQPVDVKPSIQPQALDTAQPLDVQPSVQPQALDTAQLVDVKPTVQPQVVDTPQPLDVKPSVQPQIVETAQPLDVKPSVQPQALDTAQPLDVKPSVQPQALDTAQPLDVQPSVQPQAVDTAQPLDVQPTVQPQTVETPQPLDVQPRVQPQAVETPQPLDVQPRVQPQAVETPQPVDVQPTVQPQTVETPQLVDVQPRVQPQAVDAAQLVDVPPSIQPQVVETAQPAQIQQTTQSQPFIAPQQIDERPTVQNFSELLGVKVEVTEAPTSAPVTPPQSTPQQFNQEPNQQDTRNFQQTFQSTVDAPQAQPVSTGGEVFVAPISTGNDVTQPQQVTQTQAPDTPPMPQDDFDIPAQIVRQARLIRTAENTEMVIKLNPEHLGELTLRVSVSANGAVNASFHSDNAQVRTIIENSLVQLRQELSNIGLKVEHVDVYAGLSDGGLMNGQGGQAWQQNRQQRQGNRRLDMDAIEKDIETTAPVNESTTEGVDYSV